MRAGIFAVFLASGCHTSTPEGAELTHAECADLVRHVQKLDSADTGGLSATLQVGLKSGIEGCLMNGTTRAYRCVLQAETAKDLEICDSLFK
jgi:hypothetical protein